VILAMNEIKEYFKNFFDQLLNYRYNSEISAEDYEFEKWFSDCLKEDN